MIVCVIANCGFDSFEAAEEFQVKYGFPDSVCSLDYLNWKYNH